jgi:hypothetical protein
VRVGDPFVVSVRVRAPAGATIEFPAGPDSGGPVESLDPVRIETAADSVAIDKTAHYRLAAWRVGEFGIRFDDVIVRQDVGTRRIPVTGAGIVVASVLPPDSAAIDPKPPRPVYTFGYPWWLYAIAAAAALGVLALIVWLWRRRRRRPPSREAPFAVAEREFNRVEAIGLLAAGERARYVALMIEVLRDYLAAAVPMASTSDTSTELAGALRRAGIGAYARCAALLAEVDLIKFARRPLTTDRAAALGKEARAVAAAVQASAAAAERAARTGTSKSGTAKAGISKAA